MDGLAPDSKLGLTSVVENVSRISARSAPLTYVDNGVNMMAKVRTGKFEHFFNLYGDGKFYWRLKSPNGRVICQSEGYNRKADCLNGIRAVATVAGGARVVDLDG